MKVMISATIITLNEENDLPRCLKSLDFVDEIILVDSGSTDHTVDIARGLGAKVIHESWHGYGAQKNFAMGQCKHSWVLNIDADEIITPDLKEEILNQVCLKNSAAGYAFARKTFYMGRWIRYGGWYPNYVTRLVQKENASWTEPNVHEELMVTGEIKRLKNPMLHFTFTDLSDQIRTNMRYAKQGALDLKYHHETPSLVKLLTKPIAKFTETYIFKRGFLDGLPGFIISVNAAHSMFMKYVYLWEMSQKKEK